MKSSRTTSSLALCLALVLAPAASALAADDPASAIAADVVDAAPGVLDGAAQVSTTAGGTDAIKATVAGTEISVPADPAAGVQLDSAQGAAVRIDLPVAAGADDAVVLQKGVVGFDNNNGSATVVKAGSDGSAQFLTTIESASAPTTYRYPITVENGGGLVLTSDGGVNVVDSAGAVVSVISAPWAKDANGGSVATSYTVEGSTLVQTVQHGPGTAYPVVADPFVRRWYGWDFELNRNQTNNVMLGLAGVAVTSLGIPDPTISKVVAGVLGANTAYANWAYNRGGCLKLRVTFAGLTPVGAPGHYYGGNCR